MQALLTSLKDWTGFIFHGAVTRLVDLYMPLLGKTLPSPYREEIHGISQATNIPLGEVVLYNIFYEIFTVCTSIIAEGPDGKMYHGRNLDFGLFLG
jgi:acid ceramidase